MNGDTPKMTAASAVLPPSSPATKRKPVPTPRSTLRKPASDKDERERRRIIINNGADSQGQTSGDSPSPDDDGGSCDGHRRVKTGGEDGEDILAALEKIPGVGSLRSLNSVGSSSQPSLSLDHGRVRREESSHSLASGLSFGGLGSERGGSDRKRSLGERSRTSPRILLLNGKNKVESADRSPLTTGSSSNSHDEGEETDGTSASSPASPGKLVQRGTEKRRSIKSVKILEDDDDDDDDDDDQQPPKKAVQDRPLPDIPPKTDQKNNQEQEEVGSSNSDDIYTSLLTPEDDHYQELNPTIVVKATTNTKKTAIAEEAAETSTTNLLIHTSCRSSKRSTFKTTTTTNNGSLPSLTSSKNNYLTMTGTIKRGKLPERSVDIQLSVTPDHLSKLEQRVHDKYHDRCFCGLRRGPHVFLLSLISIPFMLVYSTLQAFFLGSMTWFNIFIYYNEERTCCHKLLSPFILLLYPFWILPVTLGLGLYGAVRCISWYWDSWLAEVRNPDSGFMAWICTRLTLPDCAPYQVVLLSAEESLANNCPPPSTV